MTPSSFSALKQRVLLISLSGMLITGLLIGVITSWPLYQAIRTNLLQSTQYQLQTQSLLMNHLFEQSHALAAQLASRTEVRRRLLAYHQQALSLAELQEFSIPRLRDALDSSTRLAGLIRFDQQGNAVIQIGQQPDLPLATHLYPAIGEQPTSYLIQQDNQLGDWLVVTPLYEEGQRIGTDWLLLQTDALLAALQPVHHQGEFSLIDHKQALRWTFSADHLVSQPLSADNHSAALNLALSLEHFSLELHQAAQDLHSFSLKQLFWPSSLLLLLLISSAGLLVRVLRPLLEEAVYQAARLEAQQRSVQHQADHDALTGLPNRSLLERRITLALTNQRPLALLFMDLDHFKEVNDQLGHAMGDQLLKRVGERLSHLIRQQDTLGRLGGDEFLILLEEPSHDALACQLAQRIIDALTQPFQLGEHQVRIGVSIGISQAPLDATDKASLIHAADQAMYQAKAAGRNRWRKAKPD
ncbi:GGDEF domain-containing protein [Marinospirillum sp. MEB164]|uniref:GGDEF domain-containing protein n=1 Tax=Marinospirillum alkalitolerans TaxID=3123374 RepID=A0ABW8PXX2_9GAMM